MKASEELIAARNALYDAIKPALQAYEERTGLCIDEIAIDRPYAVGVQSIAEPQPLYLARPMLGIKVRTNAGSL